MVLWLLLFIILCGYWQGRIRVDFTKVHIRRSELFQDVKRTDLTRSGVSVIGIAALNAITKDHSRKTTITESNKSRTIGPRKKCLEFERVIDHRRGGGGCLFRRRRRRRQVNFCFGGGVFFRNRDSVLLFANTAMEGRWGVFTSVVNEHLDLETIQDKDLFENIGPFPIHGRIARLPRICNIRVSNSPRTHNGVILDVVEKLGDFSLD